MILKEVKLKNFRSYEDETKFIFSPSEKKNIVLIGGENGAGKSTLFEAIKLCIYGPITYGYQGYNSNYIAKIKSNINHNAYKEADMNAYIGITIVLTEGTNKNTYELLRHWIIEDKKLIETYEVKKNNDVLTNEAENYFQNYLTSLIPPNLFDFFFFDGEDLPDAFIGRSASIHLKESILKLNNYDTLDILKKHLLQYQRNSALSSEKLKDLEIEYNLANEELCNNKNTLESLMLDLKKGKIKLENMNLRKSKLEENFRKSGGLLENEKNLLVAKQNSLENERANIYQFIKDFCNDTLPLLLSEKLLIKIKKQILDEDSLQTYKSFKNKLNEEVIKSSLIEATVITDSNLNLSSVPSLILSKLFDTERLYNVKTIHSLSNDDKQYILLKIDYILNNKKTLSTIINQKYTRSNKITEELKVIREKINSSVSENILKEYLDNNLKLNEKIGHKNAQIEKLTSQIEILKEEIHSSENKLKKVKNAYLHSLQVSKTLQVSNNLVETLDEIIFELTKEKIHEIEDNFIYIFKEIIKKDNYIDSIEIQSNFDITLYINKEYSSIEILNLLKNLGIDDVEKKYGSKFIEDLKKFYPSNSKKELLHNVENNLRFESLILRTKFNITDFSKGEKQIYILCLVWALIKSSGVQIPFVIDTPYARIDEAHRDLLTTKYLPNISNQVIILSTNEEIDKKLYSTMKHYICNEYLLQFLDKERKTIVYNRYFFEV
ncbi:AAA family ATPase [Clostridium kluyveri]|uniref:AAA family ATPase n=1 Tax=Clostridium kluyveri TaxID=1534 RepID=UPI002246780E|nr:AAA family ATPase [Clostridium kluyveri]UZQ50939.1 AAA family ATPase [Clostridium kluyveri]